MESVKGLAGLVRELRGVGAMANSIFMYCAGCDEVSRWGPDDEKCDVCGEPLETGEEGGVGISLLIQTHARADKAEVDLAAMTDRIDKAWHAVCCTTMPGPKALAHLLEILDGQHKGEDPHMAAIAVLRERRGE